MRPHPAAQTESEAKHHAQDPRPEAGHGPLPRPKRPRSGHIELTPEICRRWQAYAGSRDMSLTAMARECVARCMAEDSLAAEAGAAASPAGAAHAAGGPRPMRPARVDRGIEGMEGMD